MQLPVGESAPPVSVADSEEEREFRTIAESPRFRKAPAVRMLLLYLWRHKGESISEYAIATEALARRSDFNPKLDATVRVHTARLRQKLVEFYDNEGRDCRLRLSIPLGGHELEAQLKPPEMNVAAPLPIPGRLRPGGLPFVWLSLVLAAACIFLYFQNRTLASRVHRQAGTSALPRFWGSFLSNGKPASLYLPTPVFFEWKNNNYKIRDTLVNDFAEFGKSPELTELAKRWGPAQLMQNYTVVSDTFAALKLAQYFEGKGRSASFGGTADLSLESIGNQNVILIGIPATSRQIRQLMEKTNFYSLMGHSKAILNRRPRAGEAARYEEVIQSETRRTCPGIIAVLPGPTAGTRVLMLTGKYTASLVSVLISPESLASFEKALQRASSPDYFEALVQVEMDGNNVLAAWTMAVRPIETSVW